MNQGFQIDGTLKLWLSCLVIVGSLNLKAQRSCVDLADSQDALLHYELIDLVFDSEGKPRYQDQVLDSVVTYDCDSLCDIYRYGSTYFYVDGRLDFVFGGGFGKVTYNDSSFKIGDSEESITYTYRDNLLSRSRYHRNGLTSTYSEGTTISRDSAGRIEYVSTSSDYQGGLSTSTDSRSSYIYNGDTLKAIEISESGFTSGTFPPNWNDSTYIDFEYLPVEVIVRKNSRLESRYTCEIANDSENLEETLYEYDDGDWVIESVTTFDKKLVPLSVERYHLDNPLTLTNYFYSDTVSNNVDVDGDGFYGMFDCDDTNPEINSGQTEIPYNGLDDDCNNNTPDDDLDGDGYPLAEDCDDTKNYVHPDAFDYPHNDLDEDCDGSANIVPGIHFVSDFTWNAGGFFYPIVYDSVCVRQGFYIVFNDYQDYVSYEWDLGDGDSLSGPGYHRYSYDDTGGMKTVTVEVIDSFGQSTVFRDSILVKDKPEGDWNFEIIGNQQVQFFAEGDTSYTYAWDFGDGAMSTEKDPIHSYEEAFFYNVSLISRNKCGSTEQGQLLNLINTSTSDLRVPIVRLYPNPNNGIFNVKISDIDKATLQVVDNWGRRVWSSHWLSSREDQLDLSHLPEGVYVLEVTHNNEVFRKRFVISK